VAKGTCVSNVCSFSLRAREVLRRRIFTCTDPDHPAILIFGLDPLSANRAKPGWVLFGHSVNTNKPVVICQPPGDSNSVQTGFHFDLLRIFQVDL